MQQALALGPDRGAVRFRAALESASLGATPRWESHELAHVSGYPESLPSTSVFPSVKWGEGA